MNGLTGAVAASIVVHTVGLSAATMLVTAPHALEAPPIAIEVVRIDPPPPPPPPPPAPKVAARARPRPAPVPALPAPRTEPIDQSTATLMADTPQVASAASSAPSTPNHWISRAATAAGGIPAPGPPAGTGALFSTGDLPVLRGDGVAGGSGGGSEGGSGDASGAGGVAAVGPGAGLTSFARPLGGYQTTPPYPESARRAGLEGTTTLRFEVLTDGRVGRVQVTGSAGHPDLDRAAADAVRSWRFEPARRGKEAVAVWVTLPVRFALSAY